MGILWKKSSRWLVQFRFVGVDSGGGTPDPIPNSEVKPASGDGTARFAVWKSSTTPTLFCKGFHENGTLFLCAVWPLIISDLFDRMPTRLPDYMHLVREITTKLLA